MSTQLLASKSVLHRRTRDKSRRVQIFGYKHEDIQDGSDRVLDIDRGTWEELGSPETLTVTIEPGDKLN